MIRAHLALVAVTLLYGANYLVAKGITPEFLSPRGLVFIRITGTFLLFGLLFLGRIQRVEKKDLLRLAACGFFGVFGNQLFFIWGLSMTSAMNSAILMCFNPIMVVLIASVVLKERITLRKGTGVLSGIIGATGVILTSSLYGNNHGDAFGDALILINALAYAIYLVLVKPLMSRYQPMTVITWVFLFGSLYILPFGVGDVAATDFNAFPDDVLVSLAYVVIGVTFFAYLLNIFSLKFVSPAVTSSYIYFQPITTMVLAVLFASYFGKEHSAGLDWFHGVFAGLIFLGVYLVSSRKKRKVPTG